MWNFIHFIRRKGIAIILFSPFLVYGQNFKGLLLNDASYNSLPRQPLYDEGSKAENEVLKNNPAVDLKPWCPYPQNQGNISSCTGWASGYGAMSILFALHKGWKDKRDTITQNALSALFIYNQIKEGSCDAGSYIDKAGALLRDKGDLPSKKYDKFKNSCDRQPTDEELQLAANFKLKDYNSLFSTEDGQQVKIQKTKLSLAQKRPVVIGMLLRKNFEYVRKKDRFWYPDNGDTTFHGAHAMVVVGYDDGKEAFEIMNSWGTNWGNDGFVWVKYKDYARFCSYGIQFIPPDGPNLQNYSAKIALKKPYYDENNNLKFDPQDIYFNGKTYELSQETVEPGFILQPWLQYATEETYFYAFSYDTKGQVKVHWPRDGHLDGKFDGKTESAVVTISNPNIAIPGESSALDFNFSGTEYVCFLLARQPIDNFNTCLRSLQQSSAGGDFIKNLYRAFDNVLIPLKNIRYNTEMPGFNNPISKGLAVPIVVQIRIR